MFWELISREHLAEADRPAVEELQQLVNEVGGWVGGWRGEPWRGGRGL
jgi:hypothetical protein